MESGKLIAAVASRPSARARRVVIATGGIGLLAAGPIVAALAGAGAGAAAGGLVGALVGWGIPDHHIKFYKDALEKGSVLLGVKAPARRRDWVRDTIKSFGSEDATTLSAKSGRGEQVEAGRRPSNHNK